MFNFPLAGTLTPSMTDLPPVKARKPNWRQSLFDKLMPDDGLEDPQKEALLRQGLLQAGLSMLSTGGGFGNALGQSLQSGLLAMNQGVDDIDKRKYRRQMIAATQGGGSAFAALDAQARAAGYEPGSQGYKDFMRRENGEIARASSAGAQSFEMADENGVPTRYTFNPRTGQYEKAMIGAAPQMPGADPAMQPDGDVFAGLPQIPGVRVTSALRSPERNARVGGVDNSFHLQPGPAGTGMARDILPPQTPEQAAAVRQYAQANGLEVIDEGDHWHLEPRGRPIVGRRKEDEAGAVTAAQQAAEIAAMPARNALEAQGAGQSEAAKEKARLDAYIAATAPTVAREAAVTGARKGAEAQSEMDATRAKRERDSNDTLGLLAEAERIIPGATGSVIGTGVDALAGAAGRATEGAKATARLKAIAGQLTAKMPRMEGPQSNFDVKLYQDMAGDLANPMVPRERRLAALETIRALNLKYATQPAQPDAPRSPAVGGWGIRPKGN